MQPSLVLALINFAWAQKYLELKSHASLVTIDPASLHSAAFATDFTKSMSPKALGRLQSFSVETTCPALISHW